MKNTKSALQASILSDFNSRKDIVNNSNDNQKGLLDKPKFASPIWAGFECTYATIKPETEVDLLAAKKHDTFVQEDYELMLENGFGTVREGFSWSQIDLGGGEYDFERFEPILQAGKDLGIEQIWDLNHFDYPDYLDPLSDEFVISFAKYAQACLTKIKQYHNGQIYILPINEISFWSWIGGMVGVWAPFLKGRENELAIKKQYVRAAIAAQDAIWEFDPSVRFIHADPILYRKPRMGASDKEIQAIEYFNTHIRTAAWDMLSGKLHPELGGNAKYLDIIGINYYVNNQQYSSRQTDDQGSIIFEEIPWDSSDRLSFADIVAELYDKYSRPMVITETGCFGNRRFSWWQRLVKESEEARKRGLPLEAICAYPVLDQPKNIPIFGPKSGLFDFDKENKGKLNPQLDCIALLNEFKDGYNL